MDIRNNLNVKRVNFAGHKKQLDKAGYVTHNFFYLYDKNKYSCEVELFNIKKDDKGNYSVAKKPAVTYSLDAGPQEVDIDTNPKLISEEGFAYRFKLTELDENGNIPEKDQKVSYAFDNGDVIGIFDTENADNKFNLILSNRATINKNGPMQLIMPDEYYPGVIKGTDGKPTLSESLRAKALTSVRNHANKLGGKLFGIVERLPELKNEGVSRIVGTPFTKDTISSHLYWTENAYRVAPSLGSDEEFKVMQEELFKHGINWISDAALVNEGFGGVHLSELLRKGPDSVSKDMFRAEEKISLGVLPDKCDYTRMKIINAPFVITQDGDYEAKNPSYDPAKPTYVQFYDERLASAEQVASDKPIDMTTYENKNTDNIYDITKHDDAVYPFPIEVDPAELKRNVQNIYKKEGSINLKNIDTIKAATDFTYFNVVNKSSAGGLEVWDGNVDIAKLNFYRADKDDERFAYLPEYQKQAAIEDFDRGALAVRDYAINSGKYWTKLAADTQMNYAASLFGLDKNLQKPEDYLAEIQKLAGAKKEFGVPSIPASSSEVVDLEIVKNVLNGEYHSRFIDDEDVRSSTIPETTEDFITKLAMDTPLETLPIATNLLGVITSPYIAKKASVEDELGVSRFDLYSEMNPNLPEKYADVYNQMDDIYAESLTDIIKEVVSEVSGMTDGTGRVTDLGKFQLNEVVPDITRYLLTKAINPDANIIVDDAGKFDFSQVDEGAMTIQSLGIPYSGKTLEQEAAIVVDKIREGLEEIPQDEIDDLKAKISTRLENKDENSYRIAEMIVDRTESGLGWRIDAAKDIAAIDSVRADVDSMTSAWDNVIDFWKGYNQSVLLENPHAYTTAEITDLSDLFANEDKSLFTSDGDAERKFLQQTGITAVANYNYFFSLLPDLFAPLKLEAPFGDTNGWQADQEKNFKLLEKMNEGWGGTNPGFLFQSPDDGVVNSYTFVGNHDKPRMLHLLSFDVDLFNSDFSNEEHKKIAAKVLDKDVSKIDFDKQNSMAIAMGARLNEAFDAVVTNDDELSLLNNAVKNLASGYHKGKKFDATAFGTRPLEIAIDTVLAEVEYNGGTLSNPKEIKIKALENILVPAFDRFRSIYKLLVSLPGSPTDFAGDRTGLTGFETKAKNYYQQNRNVINWEWLENPDFKFVQDFYKDMNGIANLRSRKELSALNDGSTITVGLGEKTQGLVRYNDKGSVVITLHNSTGASNNYRNRMDRIYGKLSEAGKDGKVPDKSDLNEQNVISDNKKRVYLNSDSKNPKNGLKHGLKVGDVFYNASLIDDVKDKEQYVVCLDKDKNEYYLQKKVKNDKGFYQIQPTVIEPSEFNTLVLYKA